MCASENVLEEGDHDERWFLELVVVWVGWWGLRNRAIIKSVQSAKISKKSAKSAKPSKTTLCVMCKRG